MIVFRGLRYFFLFAGFWFLSALQVGTSLACRYNVRETGFVDFGMERYDLYCYVDQSTRPHFLRALERKARDLPRFSNIRLEVVDVDLQAGQQALSWLETIEKKSLPRLVLVSLGGRSREIPLPGDDPFSDETVEQVLAQIVSSPLREQIIQQAVSHLGVVLLLESGNPAADATAWTAALEAVDRVNNQLKYMPKPVSRGPVLIRCGRDSLAREEILLWSLGLDEVGFSQPRAAVLYGRARWIGPVLSGTEIDENVLYNILSVLGADCECGMDPRVIRGTGLPVTWNEKDRARVAEELGFDPENPLVMVEVSQILRMRAAFYPQGRVSPGESFATVDDLPVPFVEDKVIGVSGMESVSTLAMKSLLVAAAASGLVVLVGVFLLVRNARRDKPAGESGS